MLHIIKRILDRELTFAFSSSTMKWHKEALKKYSLALYFRRGLSMVLDPTCSHTHRQEFQSDLATAGERVTLEEFAGDGQMAYLLVNLYRFRVLF